MVIFYHSPSTVVLTTVLTIPMHIPLRLIAMPRPECKLFSGCADEPSTAKKGGFKCAVLMPQFV